MSAHIVCRLDEVAPGAARRFDIDGRSVAIVRIGDDAYALGDTCSHGAVSLSEGEVHADELEIECWKHGSTFSLETGEPLALPATKKVPVYEASVVDGNIVVSVDTVLNGAN